MRYVLAVALLLTGVTVAQDTPTNNLEINLLPVVQPKALTQHSTTLLPNGLTGISDDAANRVLADAQIISKGWASTFLLCLMLYGGWVIRTGRFEYRRKVSTGLEARLFGCVLITVGIVGLTAVQALIQFEAGQHAAKNHWSLECVRICAVVFHTTSLVVFYGFCILLFFGWFSSFYEWLKSQRSWLSDAEAHKLARQTRPEAWCEIVLYLDHLKKLTDRQAEILSTFRGGGLSLGGLKTLTNSQAEAFAKTLEALNLDGVTSLTDTQAEALTNHAADRNLSLGGLTELTDRQAVALAKQTGSLRLNGLTQLSELQAAALSKQNGDLFINGLTKISFGVAAALAQHQGGLFHQRTLSLDGVTTLSEIAAKALAQHIASLSLKGLTTLLDEAAKALAQHKGHLELYGLTTLSDEAAKALRANPAIQLPDKFK